MPKHLVSVRVTKRGTKFSRRHVAEINAANTDEALQHLQNRCAPDGEYARKWPNADFSELEAISCAAAFFINSPVNQRSGV